MGEEKVFKTIIGNIEEKNAEERTLTVIITTNAVDRDGEVIDPKGAITEHYERNPVVLWAHDYRTPPIGRCLWLKKTSRNIKAKVQFADTQFADEIYRLYQSGYLHAWSIGFIPHKWDDLDGDGKSTPKRRYTEWELLEFSAVPVPANPEALTLAVSKGELEIKSTIIRKALGLVDDEEGAENTDEEGDNMTSKGVIPYSVHGDCPKEPEDAKWDAAREVREATVEDLKVMCCWYDSDNPDVKASYKLPHHRASGSHPVVWNGVRAAMAALFGARGGVNIPDKDRKGVYNHLVKHYKQFDKEPPEFREYTEDELKALFPELYIDEEPRKDFDVCDVLLQFKFGHINLEEAEQALRECIFAQKLTECIEMIMDKYYPDDAAQKEEEEEEETPKDPAPIQQKEATQSEEPDDTIIIEDGDTHIPVSAEELREMIREGIRGEIGRLLGDVDYYVDEKEG